MQNIRFYTALVGLILPFSVGCATKSFVAESVESRAAAVEDRIAAVESSVEGVSDETRTNRARIGEVDRTATIALGAAHGAEGTAGDALDKARSLEAANRQLLFEIVLTEEHGQFRFADATLPAPAASSLDALVRRVREHAAPVFFEIEGHTDETGPAEYNKRLGLERAETVRVYLHEHHQLPLHKINVISYGEARPVVSNDSVDHRAKNRRVVVRVLGGPEDEDPSDRVAGLDQQ